MIIREHYAQGDGPTVQEIRAMERAERMKTEPENVMFSYNHTLLPLFLLFLDIVALQFCLLLLNFYFLTR